MGDVNMNRYINERFGCERYAFDMENFNCLIKDLAPTDILHLLVVAFIFGPTTAPLSFCQT